MPYRISDIMYNEQYHPVSEGTLGWMLAGEIPEHAEIIKQRVAEETEKKTRNYIVELPDGTNYVIQNGIVSGSRGYRG